jgi:hypothetical protein
MPTTISRLPDSVFPTDAGRLIQPVQTRTIVDGVDGLAVWRDDDQAIITTAREMRQNTDLKASFGRHTLRLDPDEPFWNSNDVEQGSIRFKTDWRPGQDRDGDGRDMDTFIFRFADLADQDDTGVDLWFNGQRVHIAKQANAEVDVFAIRTDEDFINFRWDSGEDVGPNGRPDPDGFALLQPCDAVPQNLAVQDIL